MTRKTIKRDGDCEHLTAISERELSAVTFVRDYIQLHFDGPTINAYVLPRVVGGESVFAPGDPGYRDALCARIGMAVHVAYACLGQQLLIEFVDGSSLSISLRPEDRVVTEAAVFTDPQSEEWTSW